jgi:hypothetical protein
VLVRDTTVSTIAKLQWSNIVDSLKSVLMMRDGLSSDEADDQINEAREEVANGADPEEVLYDLGLEPDYVFDLI